MRGGDISRPDSPAAPGSAFLGSVSFLLSLSLSPAFFLVSSLAREGVSWLGDGDGYGKGGLQLGLVLREAWTSLLFSPPCLPARQRVSQASVPMELACLRATGEIGGG